LGAFADVVSARRNRDAARQGGVFAGVAWWFYTVDDDGVYQNKDMAYTAPGRFESEPWYVGVFDKEAGEPFPGWLWYKSFLELRKLAHDKQRSWSYWNGGWGQYGIEVDQPRAETFIELAHKIGIRGFVFGSGNSGKGATGYVELARTDTTAKMNLALMRRYDIAAGFLDSGNLRGKWLSAAMMAGKDELLGDIVDAGYKQLSYDFFHTVDTFTAHRSVADYVRRSRDVMDYTECHLGMAAYGPQLQREVLINHPTDLRGFDISRFPSDWATFLGFRHSRAQWQQRYQYLMPEYGLYYFATHYSNVGHPRRYIDPEPQPASLQRRRRLLRNRVQLPRSLWLP
jgi:hypothetical protein